VAVAGPLVTAAICGVCFAACAALVGDAAGVLRAAALVPGTGALESILAYLAAINLLLLAFNLLPAFPLDGGRIVRALAWRVTGDRARATRFAGLLGRVFAYGLAGFGIYLAWEGLLLQGSWLLILALFMGQAARTAEAQSRVTSRIEGLRVADVMDAEPVAVPAELGLDRALEEFFLRYGWSWFPVIDRAGRFLGLVRRESVEDVPEADRAGRRVDEVMSVDADRELRVDLEEPLEAVLGSEGMRRLGAMMAVDEEGMLRGVVTLERVRRALRPATGLA
jgi:hypothetical protein